MVLAGWDMAPVSQGAHHVQVTLHISAQVPTAGAAVGHVLKV